MLVFTYGSLKLGQPNNLKFLGNQKFVSKARTLPEYRLYDCGKFPAMVEAKEGLSVEGELWDVDEKCLRKLDLLECINQGLYERKFIKLQAPAVEAQAYLFRFNVQGLLDCGGVWEGSGQWAKKHGDYKNGRNASEKSPRKNSITENNDSINKPTLY